MWCHFMIILLSSDFSRFGAIHYALSAEDLNFQQNNALNGLNLFAESPFISNLLPILQRIDWNTFVKNNPQESVAKTFCFSCGKTVLSKPTDLKNIFNVIPALHKLNNIDHSLSTSLLSFPLPIFSYLKNGARKTKIRLRIKLPSKFQNVKIINSLIPSRQMQIAIKTGAHIAPGLLRSIIYLNQNPENASVKNENVKKTPSFSDIYFQSKLKAIREQLNSTFTSYPFRRNIPLHLNPCYNEFVNSSGVFYYYDLIRVLKYLYGYSGWSEDRFSKPQNQTDVINDHKITNDSNSVQKIDEPIEPTTQKSINRDDNSAFSKLLKSELKYFSKIWDSARQTSSEKTGLLNSLMELVRSEQNYFSKINRIENVLTNTPLAAQEDVGDSKYPQDGIIAPPNSKIDDQKSMMIPRPESRLDNPIESNHDDLDDPQKFNQTNNNTYSPNFINSTETISWEWLKSYADLLQNKSSTLSTVGNNFFDNNKTEQPDIVRAQQNQDMKVGNVYADPEV